MQKSDLPIKCHAERETIGKKVRIKVIISPCLPGGTNDWTTATTEIIVRRVADLPIPRNMIPWMAIVMSLGWR